MVTQATVRLVALSTWLIDPLLPGHELAVAQFDVPTGVRIVCRHHSHSVRLRSVVVVGHATFHSGVELRTCEVEQTQAVDVVVVASLTVRHDRGVQHVAPALHSFCGAVAADALFAVSDRGIFITVVHDAQRDRFRDGDTTLERFTAHFNHFAIHQTTGVGDHGCSGVLNRDDLGRAAAVAAVVGRSERTLDAVLLSTLCFHSDFFQRDFHSTAVVRG